MDYDLAIIGAGWAGFNAALRAKALGLKTVLLEKSLLGGTCLNSGCIPTKTLLQTAKIYNLAKKAPLFGVKISDSQLDYCAARARADRIVQQLGRGMQSRLKGIEFIAAAAKLTSPDTIETGAKKIRAKSILIATGSRPSELKSLKFDNKKIISSDQALGLKQVPASLLIIGGGVIGCEFAALFSSLGAQVTLAELTPQLLPGIDADIAKRLEGIFKKKGVKVNTGIDAGKLELSAYQCVLVAVGRTPNNEGLGLEQAGVKKEGAAIAVDDYLRTSAANIYAAGDCTGKLMLAHFAAYQGEAAAENIAHPDRPVRAGCDSIPSCIFSEPQIASVGISEEQAKKSGAEYRVQRFDFLASGMARILEESEGFIKVISDKATEQVLGASIIGPQATELIGIFTLAIRTQLKAGDIRNTVFAHPTLSESITEAFKQDNGI